MPVSLSIQFQSYSADPLFNNAMDIGSVSFDGVQTLNIGSQSTGSGAGKVTFSPVTITRQYDTHSPAFWSKLCSGTPFQKARLTFSRPGDKAPYLTVGYSLVAIQTIHVEAGIGSEDQINEVLTFQYGAVTFTYAVQNPDGSMGTPVTFGWDRVKNVSVNTPIVLGP